MSSELDWATVRSADGLGTFLNHLRVQRGWTQADVAEHLGIPRRYLHELESGKQILAYSRLFSLMNLLRAQMVLRAESEENDPWQV
ncbi:MAG: helix-turn-helix domain-containing protein [Micrococcales bacterium]|nr:helix-turn-helix domain-containing protein [Micrococcales bacterium]MCL2666590.1 helix-turn-helix domain-containing protein [Micrococcales bacterium]